MLAPLKAKMISVSTNIKSIEGQSTMWMIAGMYCSYLLKKSVPYYLILDNECKIDIFNYDVMDIPVDVEVGIHRVVRISPFDPKKRRHTTWVNVSVNHKESDKIIRSYVFYPTQFVKNIKTGKTTKDILGVLAGNLKLIWSI